MNINEQLKTDLIKALTTLKDNTQLTIDTSEHWQNEYVIELYREDVKLAENLLNKLNKEN